MRPKILHIYSGNLYGGIETFLSDISKLTDKEFDHHFAFFYDGKIAEEIRQKKPNQVHIIGEARYSQPKSWLKPRKNLTALIKVLQFQAVFTHGQWSYLIVKNIISQQKYKRIIWQHDRYSKNVYSLLTEFAPPDHTIVNSLNTQETLPKKFLNTSSLIHCCIDVNNKQNLKKSLKQLLSIPKETVLIALYSRYERWKGHSLLLEASHILKKHELSHPWKIAIIGSPDNKTQKKYKSELLQFHKKHKLKQNVIFHPKISKISHHIQDLDIHCQPNPSPEPFGLVYIEALINKVPCISTDIGGASEIITPECGILVPPKNPQALANALATLISQPLLRKKLGSNGPKRAKELCDPKIFTQKLHQTLMQVEPRYRDFHKSDKVTPYRYNKAI